MKATSKKQADLLDIVFANRNKQYGAYILRRSYPANMGKAMLLTLLLMLTFLLFTSLINRNPIHVEQASMGKKPVGKTKIIEVVLPQKAKPITASPKIKSPLPPKIIKDELVKEPIKPDPMPKLIVTNPTATGTDNIGTDLPTGDGGTSNEEPIATASEPIPTPPAPEPTPVPNPPAPNNAIELFAEEAPEFIGGQAALLKYIRDNTLYPVMARESYIEGKVYIQFVVEKDGSISHIKVVRGIGGGCDEEAIKTVKSMPAWKPGKQNGQPIRVQFTLPIMFTLE